MLKVGLTGGLASGKSFVGGTLHSLGCHLIKADELGHEVLMPGGEAYNAAIAAFGREILDEDGAINRRRLATRVFTDSGLLARLNAIVHPAVFRREDALTAEIQAAEPGAIVVVEAAILVETGTYKRYDRLIVAVCTREQEIARAMKRDGVTREEAEARLARQLPLEEKVRLADYVVDTSGSKENTVVQVREVYRSLRSLQQ
jgi:dephospho-CoA kinase